VSALGSRKCSEHSRHQRSEHGDIVACGVNDNDRKNNTRKILLVFEIAINREENVKLIGC